MSLVLDAGALVAVDRGDRELWCLLKLERSADRVAVTNGGVIAEVWRDGSRQARLAGLLAAVRVIPIDDALGRRAGALLARSRTSDVVDASVVCLSRDGDDILTSDVRDLRVLAEAAGVHVELIPV